MVSGLLMMAVGSLIFIPAANSRNYDVFLLGLFVIGTGLALITDRLQSICHHTWSLDSAAKRISIMGVCNKGAGAIAPLIMEPLCWTMQMPFSKNSLHSIPQERP
jgi:fucose permease